MKILRLVALGGFLATTLWLTVGTRGLFVSPDESANAFFARAFAATGEFCDYNSWRYLHDLHPRSMINVYDGCLAPQSFLGLPLLGGIGYLVLGSWGMFLVTPLLAVLGVLALWDGVRRLTKDETIADATTFIFLFHPAFWYYTGRLMMHNVAFVSCVIVAVWCLVVACQRSDRWAKIAALVSGLLLGLSLLIRTSELLWLAPVFLVLLWISRKQLWWQSTALFVVGCTILLTLLGYLNLQTYHGIFINGYTYRHEPSQAMMDVTSVSELVAVEIAEAPKNPLHLALPFGFHPRAALKNVGLYGFALFPWAMTPAIVGVYFAVRSTDQRWRWFLAGSIILSAYLALLYGSWVFADNPDPRAITIGNSHVRYWLPIFVLSSIFGGFGAAALLRKISSIKIRATIIAIAALAYLGLSINAVFFAPDGFVPSRKALGTFAEKKQLILATTEENAVIIVDRADKYLFPDREVIVPLRDDETYRKAALVSQTVPVYYFGITLPQKDIDYLNEQKLGPYGLRIEPIVSIQEETLYRLVAVPL